MKSGLAFWEARSHCAHGPAGLLATGQRLGRMRDPWLQRLVAESVMDFKGSSNGIGIGCGIPGFSGW
ncbi:hypothetical protein SLA2020_198160 [Shorea laevis]